MNRLIALVSGAAHPSWRLVAFTIVFSSSVFLRTAAAGPARPVPFVVVQPDGTTFFARAVGDEWANAIETVDGFVVTRDPLGVWVYADAVPGGPPVPTSLVVGRDLPTGLTQGFRPDLFQNVADLTLSAPPLAPVLGTRRTLVILVKFANKSESTVASDWQIRFFGASNSVKDHYAVSSYNQVTIAPASESHGTANDGIVGWLTLPTNHPNTGGSTGTANQQLSKDAINAANAFVNFASYDTNNDHRVTPDELMVIVIAAGNETSYGGSAGSCSPSVWGHRWSIFAVTPPSVDGVEVRDYAQFGEMHCSTSSPPGQIATIGIMAHEVGHLGFGLPDLYDTDGSSSGIGSWSLMASGSWNGINRSGDSPSLLDPWSKYFLGWVSPTLVSGSPTTQSINAAEGDPSVFQFLAGSALTQTGEYFLVENRQKMSYDAALPGSGLLVWHIDEARTSNAAECIPGGTPACSSTVHYKVAVVQADNQFHLERNQNAGDASDPFPGATGKLSLTDSTSPSSRLWNGAASSVAITNISSSSTVMTAVFGTTSGSPPGAFNKVSPSNGATGQPSNLTLSWGASSGALSYQYCFDSTNDNACSTWTSTSSTSVSLAGLADNTTYYWQIQAINGSGATFANGSATAFWSFITAGSSGDAFEPDNAVGQASLIVVGGVQAHTFHVNGDVDWVRFSVVAGNSYTIATSGLASGVDTVLYLYGSDGVTQITSNDDFGGGPGSQITYTTDADGTRYVRVVQFAGVGTGGYVLGLAGAPGGDLPVNVPNVVGLTQAAATSAITAAGLTVGTVTLASSATVPAGSVISQNPVGGTQVVTGSGVNLVVSTGPPPVAVPNVVGLTQAAATTAITGAGLVVGTVTTASSATVPAGSIINQNPVGGTQVMTGSGVNLVVSTGLPQVAVPTVVNLTQAAATTSITGAGLVVGTVTTASSATVPAGSVISQNPVGGTRVVTGSAVNLSVSSGPPVDLSISETQTGRFMQGQRGATYAITVTNLVGSGPSSGTVTVTETLPAGLTATAVDGTGWTCAQPAGPCTRSDVLTAGASYPAITLTVNVARNAPAMVMNMATVSGGGDAVAANNTVSDQTEIAPALKRGADPDGDGRSDLAVFRPSIGGWFIRYSSQGFAIATANFYQWGLLGDVPIATDFDGDGKMEIAVWRPLNGTWYIRYSSQNYDASTPSLYQWGLVGDVPLAGDFDGDGKSDLAIFRPSIGGWFIRKSSESYAIATASLYQWGQPGDVPIAADFDGDGKAELAVWRPSNGTWYIRYSSLDYEVSAAGVYQWGQAGDVPLAGDFDGDGRNDLTIFRPSIGGWFIRYSSLGYSIATSSVFQWGQSGDVPVAADFDADGKTDLTIFRPATGEWFIRSSTHGYDAGTADVYQWGAPGDVPITP